MAREHGSAGGLAMRAPAAAEVHIGPAMTAAEAFAAIALNCSGHVMASTNFALRRDDPEGIHQLRVAIRRIRAAFAIFQDGALENHRLRIGGELHVLQLKLGAAREWDVLLADTLGRIPNRLRKNLRPLIKRVRTKRAAVSKRARAQLRTAHCGDLLLRLHAWIDNQLIYGPRRLRNRHWKQDVLSRPVGGLAAAILGAYYGKACKLGRKARRLDTKDLHRLRIRIKKLRYATEFFASLWPGRPLHRYLAALKELQDALGTLHDTAVAPALLARLKVSDGAAGALVMSALDVWLAKERRKGQKEVAALWDRFAKRKPFWEHA